MGLQKPGTGTFFSKIQTRILFGSLVRSRAHQLLAAAGVIVLVLAGIIFYHTHTSNKNLTHDENAASATIRMLKDSKNVSDMRNVASEYLATGSYGLAEQEMKQISQQTNDLNDYMGLLNICTVRDVPDKQACVKETVGKLLPHLATLSFYSVYSAASELDEAGFKKDAAIFYQRAYDIYDTTRADQYTKTRDQIKQRIAELNA